MGDLVSAENETVSYYNQEADKALENKSVGKESQEGHCSQDTTSGPSTSPDAEDLSSLDWHQHLSSTSRVVSAQEHDHRSREFEQQPVATNDSLDQTQPVKETSKTIPEIPENIELSNMPEWVDYYRKLNKAQNYTLKHKGWPHFSEVFMISALDGNGVWELKVDG